MPAGISSGGLDASPISALAAGLVGIRTPIPSTVCGRANSAPMDDPSAVNGCSVRTDEDVADPPVVVSGSPFWNTPPVSSTLVRLRKPPPTTAIFAVAPLVVPVTTSLTEKSMI